MVEFDYRFDPDLPEWPNHPDDASFRIRNITPGTVYAAIDAANEGRSDPYQVREILDAIVSIYRAGKPRPRVLDDFLAQGFRKLFDGKASTFQEAIGLTPKRGRGRPHADEWISIQRAFYVLKNRLNGMSYEDAVPEAANELNTSDWRIKEAWNSHNEAALAQWVIEHYLDGQKWTQQERVRLTRIFPDKKPVHLYCTVCNKERRVRVPEPRAGATLPWRPCCTGCGHEFPGAALHPILPEYHNAVMRIRRDVRRLVRGVLRQLIGPARFPAVELGGARYIQLRCPICRTLQMIAVPAELPAPWDVKCEGCEAIFVDVRVCSLK